jgi:precorrin-3B C17-methyltransferase
MTGRLAIVGLGPGAQELITPLASDTLAAATDLVGYAHTLPACPAPGPARLDLTIEEGPRRRRSACRAGRRSPSSPGDPGVFAMAAAVCEQIDGGDPSWRDLDVAVVPGVTAMLAVAARVGAPLGHDFCAISLSDNLKPWDVVERRLEAAASATLSCSTIRPPRRGPGNSAMRFASRAPPRSIDAGDLRACGEPAQRAH